MTFTSGAVCDIKDFEMVTKIGEGTYGSVTKSRHKRTKEIVAIKQVKMDIGEADEGIPSTTIREVSLLKSIDHVNVVQLHEIIIENHDKLYLIFEFVELDLSKYMKIHVAGGGGLPREDVAEIFKGLIRAMAHLHQMGIIHRDLKPQNILVGKDFFDTQDCKHIKVADFGLARDVAYSCDTIPLTHEVVTLWYRCPEILMGSKLYGQGVDSWALGCILAEMLTGNPLFQGECEIDQLFKIFQVLGTPMPCEVEKRTQDWAGVDKLPDWNATFPHWRSHKVTEFLGLKGAHNALEQTINRLVCLNPKFRVSAGALLEHGAMALAADEKKMEE